MPRIVGAWALSAAFALTGCGAGDAAPAVEGRTTAPATVAPPVAVPPAPTPPAPSLPRGTTPASVSIPAIDLAEPLIELGLNPDASMEVPADFDDVGWFTGGGTPGGYGPVVIAAHVDSPTGPAAFIRLRELQPGDQVEVVDVDGVAHRYTVSETADYPKSQFPTTRVFGAVARDELRLITCGGVFDPAAASYTDNRVVYAVRADA